jgi:maltooligosyltrehalose trehalohydrolase
VDGGPGVPNDARVPARLAAGPGGLGATVLGDGRTRFALWAPRALRAAVDLGGGRVVAMEAQGTGYHVGVAEDCAPGTRYRFVLDGGEPRPDPASRFQPEGIFGPSEVVDLGAHRWADAGFQPRPLADQVISECHVGTLTPAGTFDGCVSVLDRLVEVGITAIELMPVSEFPGRRNWGYDGVFPFSVQSSYGGPAGLQRLVAECHHRGLAVLLDVVHNHLGPLGAVLDAYGPYFSQRYTTPWGPALNFDGPGSDHVRAFFFESVAQWFCDYHLDGLRLDAIHAIVDTTAVPFVAELAELAAFLGERLGRPCWLVAETTDNDPAVVRPRDAGGQGMDALWNDDFHHSLHVALTGERGAYYADYRGHDDLALALEEGFVLRGQYSVFRGRRHGTPSPVVEPKRLVVYAQNHDQVGNRPKGERLSTLLGPAAHRVALAVVLLSPGIPLLFMGDEYGETAPFPFFTDHPDAALTEATHAGRARLLKRMGFDDPPLDEADASTFAAAVLDRSLAGSAPHAEVLELTRRLIALRRGYPALRRALRSDVRASVLGSVLCVVRSDPRGDALCLFNLGPDAAPAAVPGTGPVGRWRLLLDSADPAVGGSGGGQPPELAAPGRLTLGPFGFCVLGSGAEEGS